MTPVTIELCLGHTDPAGKKHTRVTFGRRISGKQLFDIDANPQSAIATQNSDLLMSASITEFGSLMMPVTLLVLLNLDSLDREDMGDAFQQFLDEGLSKECPLCWRENPDAADAEDASKCYGCGGTGRVERKVEYPAVGSVKLAIGYESNGLVYDLVEFGIRLTGMHAVEADNLGLTGIKRVLFLCGKQVSKLKQTEGASELEGPIGIDLFEKLDLIDIGAIRTAAEVWRHSFRRPGARVSQ